MASRSCPPPARARRWPPSSAASASPAPTCRPTTSSAWSTRRWSAGAASTCWSTAPATARKGQILEITDEQWHAGLDVYLMNVIRPTRLVTPVMVAQKGGAIVNISTAWAFEPSAMFPTSGVARAGLAAYTKIFADTYAADNVRMNNVLPGWTDSLPQTDARRDTRADEALRHGGGDRRHRRLPRLRRWRLHHRPEHPRRRRPDALGVSCKGALRAPITSPRRSARARTRCRRSPTPRTSTSCRSRRR